MNEDPKGKNRLDRDTGTGSRRDPSRFLGGVGLPDGSDAHWELTWIGRYVLMPDHVHLFAGFGPESISLSAWQKSFKNAISKVLRSARFPPPHWQPGSFDHLIRSHESYDQKWSYVRENPVRAGLVRSADEWPFAREVFQLWRH